MKKVLAIICSLALSLSLAACGNGAGNQQTAADQSKGAGNAEPLRVTLPTWTGYGPLFLAQEKGFFEKHGVKVELSIIEGLAERKQAIAGGKVDGMATALDVLATLAASEVPNQVVWVLDDSYGGDGILAKKEIQSPADLKGKKVAFEIGTTSHLLVLTALKQAGLTEKDIEAINMTAGDAGAAFTAGKVDAAVTWEPWLSKGSAADGKVLLSTKDLPGIIVDAVGFRKDVVDKRPDDVKAFVAAMAEAMDYWKEHEDESHEIMAKGLKIDVNEFVDTAKGLKFLGKEENKQTLGTSSSPGPLYQSAKDAIDFYLEQKVIDKTPAPEEMINPSFVEGL
ncbi:ABC transporter substrate-binding protein [Brevibacillus sp. B_LB10_24]|uniref:ABC transporter substrate-binding protein n=1 Tax=Brevibacillus sp. B_LB10_24 TaxID=3380645 RepID=UPI0038BDC390